MKIRTALTTCTKNFSPTKIHILHTDFCTFALVIIRKICDKIKGLLPLMITLRFLLSQNVTFDYEVVSQGEFKCG